jgi:triosephosphate isomerase
MRTPVVVGNWKMNLDRAQAVALARALREATRDAACEVGVAPPFPYLAAVAEALRGSALFVAAQNLHVEPHGAFTGEVSGAMAKDVGCTHVIVGHSERRQLLGESSDLVGRKLKSALAQGLVPILCVGETGAQRQAGRSVAVVLEQLETAVDGLAEAQAAPLLIAYEPVWAIGTGLNATAEQASEMHRLLRDRLTTRFSPRFADAARILYGGSVKPENAGELLRGDHVDGALVGGASLGAASFTAIVRACPGRALSTHSKGVPT